MIGIASLLSFFIVFSIITQTNLLLLIALIFILSGVVGHARIYLKAHSLKEVIIGFSVGFISPLFLFYNSVYI